MSKPSAERYMIDLQPANLSRTIAKLAAPAILENLLVTAVFFADALLIGWLKDDVALAAVGLGGTVMFVANGLFQAMAVGAIALVARFCGERDLARAEHVAAQALLLGFLFSGLLMALVIPLADPLLVLLGAEPDVVREGARYIRIVMSTSLLSFPMMVANGIMRGAGDTFTPMWITLAMNVWNVAAAVLLVFGPGPFPEMRLVGAGWAAASARAIGGVLALAVLFSGRTALRVRPASLLRWDGALVWRILRLALPNLGESLISRAGYLAFISIVTRLGTVPLAAHQVALRVESISFMPGWGLSVSAATLAGQYLGAGDEDMADRAIRRNLLWAVVLMGSVGGFFALFGRSIVTIFGSTPEVLDLAGMAVRIAAVEQPFLGAQMVLAGGLRGAGDTHTPMWVTLFGVAFLRVAVVYLFAVALGWGLAGVWWGTAVDWAGRSMLIWWFFRRGKWKALRV
ncbi:MAG: MATE family efflux transporter [Chloroflexia bacterium]|nr:MATE family efflux transporter [Chloroflexia bacterium]